MKIPAHKVIGDVGKPGQIVNEPKRKISFYEWYTDNWNWADPHNMEDLEELWYAAQENK